MYAERRFLQREYQRFKGRIKCYRNRACNVYILSRVVRKPDFAYAKTKTQISFAVTAKLISAFVFATRIVQFLFYLNPKFQASSNLLWLYSPVCVRPGRKPRRSVFSQRGYFVFVVSFSSFQIVLSYSCRLFLSCLSRLDVHICCI